MRDEVTFGQRRPPPGVVRLGLNENLFVPSSLLQEVIEDALKDFEPRYYPPPLAEPVADAIAQSIGTKPEEIVVTPGSVEFTTLLSIYAIRNSYQAVVTPPTFDEYERQLTLHNVQVEKIPLTHDFGLNMEKLVEAARKGRMLIICSPNNPTGNQFPRKQVLEIVEEAKAPVIVDEAYGEYAKYVLAPEAPAYPNLIVLRTFSKAYALAGLRAGYAVMNKELANEIRGLNPPFTVSSFTQKVIIEVLKRKNIFLKYVEKAKNERKWLYERLVELRGVHPYPSDAIFILFKTEVNPSKLHKLLVQRGYYLRNTSVNPLLRGTLRVTIAPRNILQGFLKSLKDSLEVEMIKS